ncbi:MAG: hypothetical protein IJB59_05770 [Oscillospiraceae bacterium]|nr:hypothetical protein [Oscillospiraceae bacterium]
MKKFVSIVLALSMAFAMTACGGNAEAETTVPAQEAPASALEVLETIWNDYAEDEKFAVIGGSMAAPVDGAPGAYDLADENISFNLLIPAEQLSNVTEAASMIHMMNANSFTGAVYKLAGGVKAADFGAAMKDAILANQWMCGFPDKLLVSAFGDQYVLVAFGVNDAMDPFIQHFNAVYPGFVTIAEEAIA